MLKKPKKGHKSKPPPPPIRLSRNSSARNVLKASEHHALKEEDFAAGIKPGDSSRKGLPNQHALLLLQQINRAVKEPFHPVGLSFYDKVNSLKIDNAGTLLKEMSWREFFSGKTIEEVREAKEAAKQAKLRRSGMGSNSYRSPSPSQSFRGRREQRLDTTLTTVGTEFGHETHAVTGYPEDELPMKNSRPSSASRQSHGRRWSSPSPQAKDAERSFYQESPGPTQNYPAKHQQAPSAAANERGLQRIMSISLQLCARIELLWKELKISTADREFYRQTLLKVNATQPIDASMKQCEELVYYVRKLQEFRRNTINVLRAIESREEALHRVWGVIGSLHRQKRKMELHAEDDGNTPGKYYPANAPVGRLNRPSANTGAGENGNHDLQMQKEEVLLCLRDLQECTASVVHGIQEWRGLLWRPLPFLWTPNKHGAAPIMNLDFSADNIDRQRRNTQENTVRTTNYMLKVMEDMRILEHSEVLMQVLLSVPLCHEDMACLLPAIDKATHVQGINDQGSPIRLPSHFGSSTGKAESPNRAVSSTTLRDWFRADNSQASVGTAGESIAANGTRAFTLAAAAAILEEEPALLRAVALERQALLNSGTFIPSIRVDSQVPREVQEYKTANSDDSPPQKLFPDSAPGTPSRRGGLEIEAPAFEPPVPALSATDKQSTELHVYKQLTEIKVSEEANESFTYEEDFN